MSREIKFRAWDTATEKWCGYEDTGHIIDLYHSITNNCFMVDNDSYDFPRDVTLSQYSGLKDKNGVEIYEGDVVRSFMGRIQPVIFQDGMFTLGVATLVGGSSFGPEHTDGIRQPQIYHEVIGNIYENPELLEGNK